MNETLPDSRARNGATILMGAGGVWVPVFCASCGKEGGMVPEENMTFAFWLCRPCAETHGAIAGTMLMPDEVFWRLVQEAQIEKYGRVLTAEEITVSLADPESLESQLARDRSALTPRAGGSIHIIDAQHTHHSGADTPPNGG